MKLISKFLLFTAGIAILGMGACKKSFLNRLPSDEVPIEDAFKTTTGAHAAMEGLHRLMYRATGEESFGQKTLDLANDLMGEDMIIITPGAGWYERYASYQYVRNGVSYPWTYYYEFINNCNYILENIDSATGPQSVKDNIKGQTYFYLAFAYYHLTIYYQHTYIADSTAPGVPIYHHTTKVGNKRASLVNNYKEINADLNKAAFYLNPANGAPTRPNISEINIDVVRGFKARVALVMQRWHEAEVMATKARQNYPYMNAKQLLGGFLTKNSSWIWGSTLNESQTNNTYSFLSQMDPNAGGYAKLGDQKCVNKFLLRLMPHDSSSVDGYDIRFKWWYYHKHPNTDPLPKPFINYSQKKFRQPNVGSFADDVCYMRAAEMGFIEAEAQAHQGELAKARHTLVNIMKIRNPKYKIPQRAYSNKDNLLIEIWHQRRIELWGEGFRYPDLQRCAVLPAAEGKDGNGLLFYQGLHRENLGGALGIYQGTETFTDPLSNRFRFRIPTGEFRFNDKMTQNPQ